MKALLFRRFCLSGMVAVLCACSTTDARHAHASYQPREITSEPSPGRAVRQPGGWYALNYPYYWQAGPRVSYDEPYDYNGNYFPLRER